MPPGVERAWAGPAISVRNVVVSYDGRRILDGINLDISRGETMVLLGGSGSGKSTLLRQIIGLERPRSGQILVNGVDLANCGQRDLRKIRRSIGVAFQNAALFNSMSVEENVALALREHTQLPEPTIRLMTWMKLAVVGLGEFGKLSPQALSGGMKKRAAVARALSLDPEILVFEMASAFRIADRMAMLYKGSMIAVGTKEELASSSHPRIRQFLDRVPDEMADMATIDEKFQRYLKGGSV